jgi:hypothetical protein
MATVKQDAGPRLSDDELVEVLGLIKEADSVELKLTVPEDRQRSAIDALRMDPLDAQIRQAFFFDTPKLDLYESGLVVRARRVQVKGDDSVVKLRPVVPGELAPELRQADGFGVEVDAMPGGFVCSASMKHALKKPLVRSAVTGGGAAISDLFSKAQRSLYEANAPDGIALDSLAVLGPIFVLKLKWSPKGLGRKLVAEGWLYPDNTIILELSTKCAPAEAFQVAAETRAFLTEQGVDLGGEQQTKTRTALEFFAKKLTWDT